MRFFFINFVPIIIYQIFARTRNTSHNANVSFFIPRMEKESGFFLKYLIIDALSIIEIINNLGRAYGRIPDPEN